MAPRRARAVLRITGRDTNGGEPGNRHYHHHRDSGTVVPRIVRSHVSGFRLRLCTRGRWAAVSRGRGHRGQRTAPRRDAELDESRLGGGAPKTPMIRAVLFDLDGTLYDRDALAKILFEQQYRVFASELRGISRERFLRDVHAMDEHGHGEKEPGYARLVRAWQLDDALAPRLFEHFFATYTTLCVPSKENANT